MYNPTNFKYIRDISISNCKTSSLASSSTASKSNFNILSHSNTPKPQPLEILLVEPMFMPEIHTKDGFQRWKMRGEHPKHKGKCSERISPDWIYTNCLQDELSGTISVIADIFHKEESLPFVTYGIGFSLKIAFQRYQT